MVLTRINWSPTPFYMKAIRHHSFGPPSVLRYEEIESPAPGAGEVRLQVEFAAVNHFDILSRRGIFPNLPLPRIVGFDCVATVIETRVARLALGQRVVVLGHRLGNGGPGAYAEQVTISAEEVFLVPEDIDSEQVVGLGISYVAALYALERHLKPLPGETVLIPGASGGVGSAAVQLAKLLGATVLATTSTPEKVVRLKALGAYVALNYSGCDVATEIKKLTDARGVDACLNAVGGESVQQSLHCLRRGGRMVLLGSAAGRHVSIDIFDFLLRELSLSGATVGKLAPTERYQYFLRLCDWIRQGKLHVIVDRVFPLADCVACHEYVEQHAQFGKVLLKP